MKAALWYKKNDIRVEEIEEPQVTKGKVKVQVKWCGICGTDLHEYLDGPIAVPIDKPHPLTGGKAPVVLGHEFSGKIVEIGENVTNLKVGDRVAVEPQIVCGKCPACKTGMYNLCPSVGYVGYSGNRGGGFAEIAIVDDEFAHKIPDSMCYEDAALAEPISVALHSVRKANFITGQTALVLGCGPIGLAIVQCLKASGARLVIVLQRKSIRQEYAKKAGADYVFDPNEINIPEKVRKLTNKLGVDAVFETTGAKIGFNVGLECTKADGIFVIASSWDSTVDFNPMSILFTEKTITGSIAYRYEFPMTLSLLADKRVNPDNFITKKIALEDIVEEGFKTLIGPDKKKHMKILVTPDKSLL